MASPSGWLQHDINSSQADLSSIPWAVRHRPPHPATPSFCLTAGASSPGSTPEGGPAPWKVTDGYMEVAPGTGPIQTRGKFGDVQLHVEWASPNPAGRQGPRSRQQRDLPDGLV